MKGLYVIRDDLADDYAPVFEAINDAVAIRSFVQLLNQVDKLSRKDYRLIKVATVECEFNILNLEPMYEVLEVEE